MCGLTVYNQLSEKLGQQELTLQGQSEASHQEVAHGKT